MEISTPEEARRHLRRIKWDTYIGMGFSNLIAFFIILGVCLVAGVVALNDLLAMQTRSTSTPECSCGAYRVVSDHCTIAQPDDALRALSE